MNKIIDLKVIWINFFWILFFKVYNNNQNFDEMLLENPANAEMTPGKPKELESDSDEESEEGDEKKKSKSTSPAQKKRSYRKSLNTTLTSKDLTIIQDAQEDADDALTNDPSKNLTKRAKTMVSLLNKSFNKADNVGFFELIKRNGKKSVVQKFYSLLVLKKYEIIDVTQAETYGDIIISKGDKFESFVST